MTVLETKRLLLRPHVAADLDDVAAVWADPAVVRHLGGKPSTREESWGRLLKYAGHFALFGYGYWAVVEKASNKYLGDIGVADFKRDIEPPLTGQPELGWVLGAHAWGRGYASEAVAAVVAFCDARLPSSRLVCIIDEQNAASRRVAEKAGFRPTGVAVFRGAPILVFHRRAGLPA